jgi:hypothetical protein
MTWQRQGISSASVVACSNLTLLHPAAAATIAWRASCFHFAKVGAIFDLGPFFRQFHDCGERDIELTSVYRSAVEQWSTVRWGSIHMVPVSTAHHGLRYTQATPRCQRSPAKRKHATVWLATLSSSWLQRSRGPPEVIISYIQGV